MLAPADLNGAHPQPVDPAVEHPLVPQPCADGSTIGPPVASRSLQAVYESPFGGRLYQVYEHVARYPIGTAPQRVADIRDQLARCPGTPQERYQLIATDIHGPGSLLILRSWDDDNDWSAYVVASTDRYLVIVAETGFTDPTGDLTIANTIGTAALRRAAAGSN